MIGIVAQSVSAAPATGNPVVAMPADRQFRAVAVEPVARAEFIGRRRSDRRPALFDPGQEDDTRRLRAVGRRAGDTPYRAADNRAAMFARPSAAFLAQHFGQEFEAGDTSAKPVEQAGMQAYVVAAERDTTFFGFAAPVDVVV